MGPGFDFTTAAVSSNSTPNEVPAPEPLGALRDIGYRGFLSVEHSAHYFGQHQDPWDRWEAATQSGWPKHRLGW